MNKSKAYKWFLVLFFAAVWVWAAINPTYRFGWFLENILVFIFVPLIIILGIYFKFSNLSYTLIAMFMALHVVGSHYTYSEVPFGYLLQSWFDSSRNMYDRLVHFSFGLLWFYPLREILMRVSKIKGVWAIYFPIDIVGAFSAVFELFEWGTVALTNPEAGLAFLGAQGDMWDAQKDMLIALVGAVIAMLITLAINFILNKEFWNEIKESLKIKKGDKPLGEVKIKEFLRKFR